MAILSEANAELIDFDAPLDFERIFSRTAALEVAFLVALAAAHPERDFLGIERLSGRIRSACKKIARDGLTNARVLRAESSEVVLHLLPSASVTAFHLLFPDPWPKRRHHRRRIVTADFLASIHCALIARGTLRIATDDVGYFRAIERLARAAKEFSIKEDSAAADGGCYNSTFGKRFQQRGLEIYRLVLRKVSDVR